jgi:broad specificity phosphatase PhoE
MRIYFVRHGETALNAEKRMMGSRFDDSLNDEGHRQAYEMARGMASDFDVVVSSPLKRALETAEYLKTIHKYDIVILDEFREFDGGLLSGMKWDKISELTGGRLTLESLRKAYETDFSEFGGESVEDVRKRVNAGLEKIKTHFPGKKVLVVTHAGILRVLYKMTGKELPALFENGKFIELDL